MDVNTLADKFVKVVVTPQGTADVYLGDVFIKTFGGAVATAAANDLKVKLVSVLEIVIGEWDDGKLIEVIEPHESGEPTESSVEKKKLTFWP